MYPKGSILIENPVAIVDKNAEAHCVMDVAQAFVDFLHTKEAKGYYTDDRLPALDRSEEGRRGRPGERVPGDQGPVHGRGLGGWDALTEKLFSDNGIATQAIANG